MTEFYTGLVVGAGLMGTGCLLLLIVVTILKELFSSIYK